MPTRFAVRTWRLRTRTVLTLLLLGCAGATDVSPSSRSFTLDVVVSDSAGKPAAGSLIVSWLWPDPSGPVLPTAADARTDSTGRLRLALGTFPGGQFDSLRLFVRTRGCVSGASHDFELHDFHLRQPDLTDAGHDTLSVELVVPPPPPAASTTPGHYCAFGVHPAWGPLPEYNFYLQVESASGELVSGTWGISHTASYGSEGGPFTGMIKDSIVALAVVNEVPESPCAGQLRGTIRADGSWGPLFFSPSEVCEGRPSRFDFAAVPSSNSAPAGGLRHGRPAPSSSSAAEGRIVGQRATIFSLE